MGTIRTKLMCYLKEVSKLSMETRAAGVDLEFIQQKHFHFGLWETQWLIH